MTDNSADNKFLTDLETASTPEEIQSAIELFNINQSKKNILWIQKLTSLQNMVADNMKKRLEDCPGMFSNKELSDYLSTLSSSIGAAVRNGATKLDTAPMIQVLQNNVTIGSSDEIDSLSEESKKKLESLFEGIIGTSNDVE